MTEIKKSLAAENTPLRATVAATLNFNRQVKHVEVRLEGSFFSEHTEALRDFLQNLCYFRGTKWTLDLENLEVISLRASKVLVKFAQVIRRRGYEIEITSIKPAMLATFMDLGMQKHFGWKFLKRQTKPPAHFPKRKLSKFTSAEEMFAEEML
ncbi:MAG: STAS domain-containing protein [candidate division KSB1 bacterium]|nr:STAS domain-containing protein [candidate division KSB1 bacterium]MDZ7366191.1 STAS domain-containing protein [candidate division KSB1 bacterium]MDZ7404409.1 STAS domain-containing protein [candidate division KSB1 bacterium]